MYIRESHQLHMTKMICSVLNGRVTHSNLGIVGSGATITVI